MHYYALVCLLLSAVGSCAAQAVCDLRFTVRSRIMTCRHVSNQFLITESQLMAMNPGLSCSGRLNSMTILCVRMSDPKNNATRQNEALVRHNNQRRLVGTRPLVWNNTLATASMAYAKKLADNACSLVHSNAAGVGENLFAAWVMGMSLPNMADGVQSWINEGYSDSLNHFTQVVWKSTTSVGCGAADGVDGSFQCRVVCCQYFPPGNWVGQSPFV